MAENQPPNSNQPTQPNKSIAFDCSPQREQRRRRRSNHHQKELMLLEKQRVIKME
jgi:hypothetical protein